jgi:hypothetical protein
MSDMMKCVNDIELMELISGKLAEVRKKEINEHLSGCIKCSERYLEAARLWETLGQWKIDTIPHKITDRVLAAAEKPLTIQKRSKFHFLEEKGLWKDALRIAALIIIAIAIGQKLGKIGMKPQTPAAVSSQTEPKYIAALGLEWSGDFTWLNIDEDSTEPESK